MKPIPYSFRHIDYFIAVAETGSTAAASRAINVSQPSISQAIAHLEKSLGQPLFIRSPAEGMILTPFGRHKLTDLRAIAVQARATLGSGLLMDEVAELDLGIFSTLGPRYVPSLLKAFEARVPNARVRLHEGDLASLYNWIETGRIDLALVYDLNVAGDVIIEPLFDISPYALVAADHRLAGKSETSLKDLLRDPLILINLPRSREFFLSMIQMQGLRADIAMETASVEMLRSMVANGFGIGLLATEPPYRQCYDGSELVHLKISDPTPLHRVALARASRIPPTWAAKEFISCAVHFGQRQIEAENAVG